MKDRNFHLSLESPFPPSPGHSCLPQPTAHGLYVIECFELWPPATLLPLLVAVINCTKLILLKGLSNDKESYIKELGYAETLSSSAAGTPGHSRVCNKRLIDCSVSKTKFKAAKFQIIVQPSFRSSCMVKSHRWSRTTEAVTWSFI